MGISDKDLLEKIFNQLFDNVFYGDNTSGDYAPSEFEAGGEIEKLYSEIYDLKHEISSDFTGDKECDCDDYPKLHQFELLYKKLWKILCYKFFVYGVLLNLHATKDSKELFMSKDSEAIGQKLKSITEYIDRETEMTIKSDISKTVLLNMYKKEWLYIQERNRKSQEIKKYIDKNEFIDNNQDFLSKLISGIKNFFK